MPHNNEEEKLVSLYCEDIFCLQHTGMGCQQQKPRIFLQVKGTWSCLDARHKEDS